MIKNKIGENAGIIWNALYNNSEMNINKLKKATRLLEKDIYLGLGWLSKENKVFFEGDKKDDNIRITDQ